MASSSSSLYKIIDIHQPLPCSHNDNVDMGRGKMSSTFPTSESVYIKEWYVDRRESVCIPVRITLPDPCLLHFPSPRTIPSQSCWTSLSLFSSLEASWLTTSNYYVRLCVCVCAQRHTSCRLSYNHWWGFALSVAKESIHQCPVILPWNGDTKRRATGVHEL